MAVIAALGEILPGYIQADRLVGSAALLLPVRSHITTVERACEVAMGQDRADVLSFASRFIEFCGWAHPGCWRAGPRDAVHQQGPGLPRSNWRPADHRVHADAQSFSIATEAGMPGHGVGMASAALARRDALTPRLRAVILRQRAQASAALGESDAASRDADAAVDESCRRGQPGEDDRAPYCSPVYAAMEAGAVRLRLANPWTALAVLERSVRAAWSDTNAAPGSRVCSLARLAEAHAAMVIVTRRAPPPNTLSQPRWPGSRRVAGQIAGLASKLAAWEDDPGTAAT